MDPQLSKEFFLIAVIAQGALLPTVMIFCAAFETSTESEGILAEVSGVVGSVWMQQACGANSTRKI